MISRSTVKSIYRKPKLSILHQNQVDHYFAGELYRKTLAVFIAAFIGDTIADKNR